MLDLDLTAEWQGGMRAIGVFEDSFKIEGTNPACIGDVAALHEFRAHIAL